MADEDDSSKTEDASDHKLEQARKEGDVPISHELKNWFTLFTCLLVVWGIFPMIMQRMLNFGKRIINNSYDIPMDTDNIQKIFGEICLELLILTIGPLLIFFAISIVSNLVQVGFLYAPKKLELKWERLDIVANLVHMFSKQKLVENLKGILKILAVLGGFYLAMRSKYDTIVKLTGIDIFAGLKILNDIILMLLFTVVIVMIVFAAIDFFIQKFNYLNKHKMTKHEIKDEYKQMEGDPLVKSKIKSLRMQRFRNNMMKAVPKADAVITNPTHYAVAIFYDTSDNEVQKKAPIVSAKGVDFLALRIKDIAKENDVPIIEDPPLARALYAAVEINNPIPEEHFEAIAKIISYVYKLKGKKLS